MKKHKGDVLSDELCFWQEFVLGALVEYKKISKHRYAEVTQFKVPYVSFSSGL